MPQPPNTYAVYYEGGTVDRFWVAPAGLSLTDAKRQRKSRYYKSEWGAVQCGVKMERDAEATEASGRG